MKKQESISKRIESLFLKSTESIIMTIETLLLKSKHIITTRIESLLLKSRKSMTTRIETLFLKRGKNMTTSIKKKQKHLEDTKLKMKLQSKGLETCIKTFKIHGHRHVSVVIEL